MSRQASAVFILSMLLSLELAAELACQDLTKREDNFAGVDQALLWTLQVPQKGEIDDKYDRKQPGGSSLVIRDAYRKRGIKDIVILRNSLSVDAKKASFGKLTEKSRIAIIGHCCLKKSEKDTQGKVTQVLSLVGNEIKGGLNPSRSAAEVVDFLNRYAPQLKGKKDPFVFSVYACSAGNQFCPDLSSKLGAAGFNAVIKCRQEPVPRLGRLSSEGQNTYLQNLSVEGECAKPALFHTQPGAPLKTTKCDAAKTNMDKELEVL